MPFRLRNKTELALEGPQLRPLFPKQTEKHLSVFADYYKDVARDVSDIQSAPLVLAGYCPGRPPKHGVLVLQGKILAFCQKSRFRESFTELSLETISAFSVSKLMKLTLINFHMAGYQFDFNSTASHEDIRSFLAALRTAKA